MKRKKRAASRREDVARYRCDVPASPGRVLALAHAIQEGLSSLLGRSPSVDLLI